MSNTSSKTEIKRRVGIALQDFDEDVQQLATKVIKIEQEELTSTLRQVKERINEAITAAAESRQAREDEINDLNSEAN